MPYAEPLRLLGLQEWIMSSLGVSSLIADVITILIVVACFFTPLFLLESGRIHVMILSILTMGFLTGIGWLPYYVWILLALYIAIGLSDSMRDYF